MNNVRRFYFVVFILVIGLGVGLLVGPKKGKTDSNVPSQNIQGSEQINENPLSIEVMRRRSYPGSDLTIEQTLSPGSNYNQYLASYLSDGLKIYGLLTVPKGEKPETGWPVIIFNHGYIQPELYRTTERYIAYVDAFAGNEYIVFKPDYRGHGSSEGQPEGAYYSPAYATDVLNAISTLKRYKDANPEKIGMWGHSMGGNISLRNIVVGSERYQSCCYLGRCSWVI